MAHGVLTLTRTATAQRQVAHVRQGLLQGDRQRTCTIEKIALSDKEFTWRRSRPGGIDKQVCSAWPSKSCSCSSSLLLTHLYSAWVPCRCKELTSEIAGWA